jgi:membrane protein implicated in regulation of membrane protease activity
MNLPAKGIEGPGGAVPHFSAQRPDHLRPDELGDDELDLAVDSLGRKLHSARRMLFLATVARLLLLAVMLFAGFAILAFGPAPFLEFIEGQRRVATTWDVFVWWVGILALASLIVALLLQASRRRRRRAAGWRHRVEDLDRRLAVALAERNRRRTR